ncbi:MAG TPA: GNAT family N-acetyltransferase [Limnobacter sp.]|nr:GNAT family N-acetyltransferase [Limnobacter sp.]
MNYRMQICQSMADMPQAPWNSLVTQANAGELHPAMRHEYLLALEASGSATADTGWGPLHLKIESDEGELLAAMPLYIKSHSYGEYVFDWAWAQAYQRHNQPYYPKLLCAVPFTPVMAPKVLARTPELQQAMAHGLAQLSQQACRDQSLLGCLPSSVHALFLTEGDQDALLGSATALGLQERHVVQFHWQNKHPDSNQPYSSFDEFLDTLNQKKRKNIRAERRKANVEGMKIERIPGQRVSEEQLAFFYQCYSRTYAEHFSTPYLTESFFRMILASMGEQVLLIVATLNGTPVASSFFLYNAHRLYGRYWGCTEDIACLHFELCYYQAIEFAIENGIQWFEGGAQGEHKMARGLNPQTMISAHWVADAGFTTPIANFLVREKAHLAAYAEELSEHQAFKRAQLANMGNGADHA